MTGASGSRKRRQKLSADNKVKTRSTGRRCVLLLVLVLVLALALALVLVLVLLLLSFSISLFYLLVLVEIFGSHFLNLFLSS